jgi:S-adenosylmethionine decarboxylase proenzyme
VEDDTGFGTHYLVDLKGCDPEPIKHVESTQAILLRAVEECGATLVNQCFHQYEPFGVSGVVLIAESHFSVHTWPEHRFVGVDIFTCGEMDAEVAIDLMRNAFQAQEIQVKTLVRGLLGRE